MSTVITTLTGRRIDLLAPDWREIDLADVARGLSQVRRFAGQSRRPFVVAQHSLVVAELARPAVRLGGLLHDGHEFVLSDWTAPAIEAVIRVGGEAVRAAIAAVRRGLDVAIARRVLEDAQAVCSHGLVIEATWLAEEMAGPCVAQADQEALRLEDSIRGQDSLSNGLSPTSSRAVELYGALAPDEGSLMLEWLRAVKQAAAERYAGGQP